MLRSVQNANKYYSNISVCGSLACFSESWKADRKMGRKSTVQEAKGKYKYQIPYDTVCTRKLSCPAWFTPGNLAGVAQEWRNDDIYTEKLGLGGVYSL